MIFWMSDNCTEAVHVAGCAHITIQVYKLKHLKEQQNFARWVTAVQPQPVIVNIQTIMGYTDAVAQASPLFPRTVF